MTCPIDKLIRAYRKIRDARADLKAQYEEADAKLVAQQEVIKAELIKLMTTTGVTKLATPDGIAFMQEKLKASIADWSDFSEWVITNQALDMLEKRVRSKAVEEYIETHGTTPPGINVYREFDVVIRKS